MIYLDSSALLKLVHDEQESAALGAWLAAQSPTPCVTSQLATVEVLRACRRIDPQVLTEARVLLADLDHVPVSSDVIEGAATVGDPTLSSLDAIHLASALSIRTELTAFVAYDRRLVEAASAAGLEIVQPGA